MIKYFDKFIVRAPLLPASILQDMDSYPSIDDFLRTVLQREEVQEALYISSPHFHDEVIKFLQGTAEGEENIKKQNKFRASALKYINRMATRSTPFGLFAGCGLGELAEAEAGITIEGQQAYQRRARLDASFLLAFANHVAKDPGIARLLLYFPNNTIYEIGDKCRYVEFADVNGRRNYNLSAFSPSPYIDQLLETAKQGATMVELALSLVDEEISLEEAEAFVAELVEAKILISELEPKVVGDDYQTQLSQVFDRILKRQPVTPSEVKAHRSIQFFRQYLQQIDQEIDQIGQAGNVSRYQSIRALTQTNDEVKSKHFLQVDSELVPEKAQLTPALMQQIREGIKTFARFCTVYPNKDLIQFQKKFSKRYENQLVPLVEALDPEFGVGFANLGVEHFGYSALVDDVLIPPKRLQGATEITWDYNQHSFLFNKILEATKEQERVIKLSDKDLERFHYDLELFPLTFNAVVSIIPQENEEQPLIYFHEGGKDSATAMVGRFGYFNPGMHGLIDQLSEFEQASLEDKVVAEINHLADPRSVNITQRPKSRKYEIGYVTKSNAPEEGLIDIRDIYIGVIKGRLVLYSKSLGKEIMPRLSNAHNYFLNCLPAYKFLAAMQEQQPRGGTMSSS